MIRRQTIGRVAESRDTTGDATGELVAGGEASKTYQHLVWGRVSSRDPKAAAQAATDMKNVVRRKLTGYVGFANLPNQYIGIRTGALLRGIERGVEQGVHEGGLSETGFTWWNGVRLRLSVIDTPGFGDFVNNDDSWRPIVENIEVDLGVQAAHHLDVQGLQGVAGRLDEVDTGVDAVRLRLSVIDTPGFGDFVNNDDSWRPIVENIEQRYDTLGPVRSFGG
jgi:hypothetical protein